MPGFFEPLPEGGAAVALDEVEIAVLGGYTAQLLELIGPGEEPGGDVEDLLASAFDDGPSEPPDDPVLARLFPDAYGDDAPTASAEFRRYTENDLRARKRDDALALMNSLDALETAGAGFAVLRLKPDECRQWLGALNDLRLAIATRLEFSDEGDERELLRLPDSDPRKSMVLAFSWLSGLQETLVESLMS